MSKGEVTPELYATAADLLDCEIAAIKAVARVESGANGAFLPSGEPVILFEPHIFSDLTNGKFDGMRADVPPGIPKEKTVISRKRWMPGTYGPTWLQHVKLQKAVTLHKNAALMSASWGLFQILGRNHRAAGHQTIQGFVNAMYKSADMHLFAFVSFIKSDARLVGALQEKNWDRFSEVFNGRLYKTHGYHLRIAEAYKEEATA